MEEDEGRNYVRKVKGPDRVLRNALVIAPVIYLAYSVAGYPSDVVRSIAKIPSQIERLVRQ